MEVFIHSKSGQQVCWHELVGTPSSFANFLCLLMKTNLPSRLLGRSYCYSPNKQSSTPGCSCTLRAFAGLLAVITVYILPMCHITWAHFSEVTYYLEANSWCLAVRKNNIWYIEEKTLLLVWECSRFRLLFSYWIKYYGFKPVSLLHHAYQTGLGLHASPFLCGSIANSEH